MGLAVWLLVRGNSGGRDADALARLEIRLDEHLKRIGAVDERLGDLKLAQQDAASQLRERLMGSFSEFREELRVILAEQGARFEQRQGEAIKHLSDLLQTGMTHLQKQIGEHLTRSTDELGKRVENLTQKTDLRLQEISGQVEKRLAEGFEKTTQTFGDILKRLALIDEAQKKITELSSNVVSLQEVLADKSSRGAFGEVQLAALVRNVLPEGSFRMQHTFSNERIADCVLFLPQPTGTVAIDAKFPLEAYRRMSMVDLPETERRLAERQFKTDILKHIQDISEKYIIPGETAEGAVMFIPAEAVFAEIQAHHPDLVDRAHAARVWMVSPTTLMAILNTVRAVLKDAATREQVHIIQVHLGFLAKDFERFQERMDALAKHIKQAHDDVETVNVSAKKITSRFQKIERVELETDKDVTIKSVDVEKRVDVDDSDEIA
ncbi:MAG: DNA recombination protein RmuC [Gammaproteobacteria bacterium]